MTPERMSELVARWVRLYTRSVPEPIARRRIDEIESDLHDHTEHERARGTGDRRIALSIAARMVRGLAADLSWRSNRKEAMSSSTKRSVIRVALVTGLILLIPAVMMLAGDDADWGVFDFVFAGVLIAGTGLLLELAARKPHNLALQAGAVAIGVAAIAFGEADDAPGLVLFGLLLIVGTVALAVRTVVRSQ
jgi:hypothetical protein